MRWMRSAAAAAAMVLSGCGGGEQDADTGGPVAPAPSPPPSPSPPPATTSGCQTRSTRFPWGQLASRTWTPSVASEPANPSVAPGSAYGPAFAARMVQAWGDDFGEARRTVILEMADGCRRQFRVDSFVEADRAAVEAEMARRSPAKDPATYAVRYDGVRTSPELVAGGSLGLHTTQHFAFWYGKDRNGDFYRTIAANGRTMEQVLEDTGIWMERQWLINRDVLGAPMPFSTGDDRQKLNIFLCGTGRPNSGGDLDGCGAGAAAEMGISAWAMARGSMVLTHEFGHMIQTYSGGFRGNPPVGVIWETGAEWNAFAISPTFHTAGPYFTQLENGPLFSVVRYAAYPFLSYLFEKDDTRDLVFRAWRENLRDGGGSTREEYVEAFVRLGQAAGVYPRGFASFADDMGWYGMRLAAMDFLNQRTLLDAQRPTRTTHWYGHHYTSMVRPDGVADTTVYAPPSQRPLLQWGTHLIPLTPTAGTVRVTLTGETIANEAAWRFGIVAVAAGDVPTYSPLARVEGTASAATSLAVPPGTRLFLAVTATPYRYESLGWQAVGEPIRGTRFPYRVAIEGATPRTAPVAACDAESQPGTWTLNYTLSGNTDRGRPCG